jgi:hypothetical protein
MLVASRLLLLLLLFPQIILGLEGLPVRVGLRMLCNDLLCKLVCAVQQAPAVAAEDLVQAG